VTECVGEGVDVRRIPTERKNQRKSCHRRPILPRLPPLLCRPSYVRSAPETKLKADHSACVEEGRPSLLFSLHLLLPLPVLPLLPFLDFPSDSILRTDLRKMQSCYCSSSKLCERDLVVELKVLRG